MAQCEPAVEVSKLLCECGVNSEKNSEIILVRCFTDMHLFKPYVFCTLGRRVISQ